MLRDAVPPMYQVYHDAFRMRSRPAGFATAPGAAHTLSRNFALPSGDMPSGAQRGFSVG
ncbi:MAG: hypothetical protein LZF60_80189 [Nitrospira sp.]|nr:MAG: hypothetical protein LZF60_80189 [Nitrospira sp.]